MKCYLVFYHRIIKTGIILLTTIFIPLILLAHTQNVKKEGKYSFVEDKDSSRVTLNLGDSSWKFIKVISKNQVNLALNKKIAISGNDNNNKVIAIDLDAVSRLESFVAKFNNTDIYSINYIIEASNDQKKWNILVDKSPEADAELVQFDNINDVDGTEKTAEFGEKKTGPYIEVNLNGKFRYIKLILKNVLNRIGKPIVPQNISIVVNGSKSLDDPDSNYSLVNCNDEKWDNVGIPHCFNDMDTYLNSSDMHMWKGTTWYRKHLYIPDKYAGKKVFLEFQGINVGAAVYVNGIFKHGNTSVEQPDSVTHVGGFLPFILDITNDLKYGEENVIAVKVSNSDNSFFKWPEFGVYEGFGMGWGGIVCPVYLHITNKLHIPFDIYSPLNKWGTYVATISAKPELARIRIQTNVENENSFSSIVTLTNNIIDSNNNIVLVLKSDKTIAAGSTVLFDLSGDIANPDLWYPNNSPYGKPNLYKIVTTVGVNGKIVDTYKSQTGLRTITWDGDYCYINGKKHLLRGFGHRNAYPALGSAIPEEIQWKDIKLIADAGGNTLRVGHVPATEVMVSACDAYGILVMQNSGDNEWSLKNEPMNTYKREYDRDMIIIFRNHPSIAVWESNNGLAMNGNKYLPVFTHSLVNQWDSLQPRIVSNRDSYPEKWPKKTLIMIGYTDEYKKVSGSPSINFEVYGASWDGLRSYNIARDDYANEKQFVNWFIDNYNSDIKNKACGWIDWMLAETQGEGYTTYLNGKSHQKSLGSCAMDGNRLPKLKYNIYKNAFWIDFLTKPGVVLQSSWNLSSLQDVDAWSNCPQVILYLNGENLGTRIPDSLTKRCTWERIQWKSGTLKVVGLDKKGKPVCSDQRITSGAPHHIILSIEPELIKPDSTKFKLTANGTDAAIITAKIVDKDGNWCPDAANDIDFEVTGEGNYRGSYNFYVNESKPITYHSPGDKQLQAEGGLMRIAIRSTFQPGKVVITATSKGLEPGTTFFTTYPVISK
jgi:beta-galactosidase